MQEGQRRERKNKKNFLVGEQQQQEREEEGREKREREMNKIQEKGHISSIPNRKTFNTDDPRLDTFNTGLLTIFLCS